MASSSSGFLLILSCFLYLINSFHSQSITLPITKDTSTLQYLTKIYHGSHLIPINLVLDLNGQLTWIDCGSSTAGLIIPSKSIKCSRATHQVISHINTNTCDVLAENGITKLATRGELVEDTISFAKSNPTTPTQFLFSCAPTFLLQGLSSEARGILGLGRSQISLPSQLATSIGHQRRFVMCLSSSSNGVVVFPMNDVVIAKSLTYTPLIVNNGEYYINVKSIKIDHNPLSIDTSLFKGGAKLSTLVPYTTMESSIYAVFTKAYMKAAIFKNLTRVDSVAPFGFCFSSKGVHGSVPTVPVIDLVLQSEMVQWRMKNSVVMVNDEVLCLGFLDGGSALGSSIVIGGFQLEDNVLEFDLSTSMLGFTTFLRGTTCSNFVNDSLTTK